jgi:hypothetical protein
MHPPSSGLADACVGTPWRFPVTGTADRTGCGPHGAAEPPETVTADHNAAVVQRGGPRLSRGYQPRSQASLVKPP